VLLLPKVLLGLGLAVASSLLSFLLRPKQPKSQRSAAPSADYGQSIPRVLGTDKVAGTLVLATLPRRVKPGGKGGLLSGGRRGEQFFGTCQVLIGEGNLHGIHGPVGSIVNDPPFLTLSNKIPRRVTTINGSSIPLATVFGNTIQAPVTPPGSPDLSITLFQETGSLLVPPRLASEIVGEMAVTTTNISSQGSIQFYSYVVQNNVIFFFNQLSVGGSGNPVTSTYSFGASGSVLIQYDLIDGFGSLGFTANTTATYNPSSPGIVGIAFLCEDVSPLTITVDSISLNRRYTINADGRLFLKKIYVNDKIWYNVDDPKTFSATKYFEFFDGRPNQSKSITLSAILGADKTPEYSGLSHIVFKDLPLHAFGGDNYPTFHFEVATNISLIPYLILKDLMYRCGVYFNRQLTEGQHYLTTSALRGITALSNLLGFQIDQQGSTPRDYLDQITQLYDISYYQVNQTPGTEGLNSLLFEKNYDFSGGVSSDTGVVIGLERKDLNSSQDRQAVPTYEISSDSRKIASSVEVKALNVNNNYESIAISLNQFVGDSNGEIVTVSFSLATNSADLLRLLAQRALVKSAHGSVEITHTDARYQTNVQDVLNVENTNLPLLRAKRVSIGANGIVQTERYAIAEGSVSTTGLLPQPNTNNNDPLPDTSYITSWFEGQRQTSAANDILAQRVAHVIIGSTSNEGLSDVTSLVYSTDGGTTSVATGQTVSPNALYCSIELTTTFTGTTVIDDVSVLDITVPSGTTLNSINDADLFLATQNLLIIPDLGIVSFGIATLTAPNTYRLSRLLWNVGQSLWDSEDKVQTDYTGFCYLMAAQFYSLAVPNTIPLESQLKYFVNQPDETLLSSATAPLRRNPELFDGLCDYPRHVTGVLLLPQDNGDLDVEWMAPNSQSLFLPSPLFSASTTDAVSYTLRLRNGAGTVLATHSGITTLSDSFTSAEIAGNTELTVTIQAQNSAGQFMPESNLVRWPV
jgi:hypothetical protein